MILEFVICYKRNNSIFEIRLKNIIIIEIENGEKYVYIRVIEIMQYDLFLQ